MSSHARRGGGDRRMRRSWWRSARLRAALGLGAVIGFGSVSTFAFWTDTATVTGTTFTAGSIELRVNNEEAVTGYTSLNIDNMVPGNSTAGLLTIKNQGLSPLKYTATTTATNGDSKNLRGALTVKVTTDTSVTGSSPSATCSSGAAAGTGSTLNSNLITTGRLLAPGGSSEVLCVQVTLPTGAASGLQGATTDVTFTFTGTSDLS